MRMTTHARTAGPLPASPLPTVLSYQHHQQSRRRAILDQAYRDGTYLGFAVGVAFCLVAWLVLSGALVGALRWAAWTWLTLLDGRV